MKRSRLRDKFLKVKNQQKLTEITKSFTDKLLYKVFEISKKSALQQSVTFFTNKASRGEKIIPKEGNGIITNNTELCEVFSKQWG